MAKDKAQVATTTTTETLAVKAEKTPKAKKPRKDGKPHPPDGMRYNRDGKVVPKLPPEMRGYYVVMGVSRRTQAPQIVSKFKSALSADRYIVGSMNLLREAYSAVSVVKCRLAKAYFAE